MTERATIHSLQPSRDALLFQAVLAADKGYTSELVLEGRDVIVVASDGQAVRFAPPRRFTKAERHAVCKASDGLPDLGTWLARIRALNIPLLTEAVDGIWCGREGRVTLDLPGSRSLLCMGWHNSRVEWSYLS